MYNRIILIGRLTRDPELRYVPSGAPVANFTLAVDRPFRDQQGNRETDFIDIVAWRKLAEQVSQYMTKGRMVAVEGRLQLRSYETQDGQKRKVAEVVADGIRFLDRGRQGTAETGTATATAAAAAPAADEAAQQSSSDEDVPF
ncbi:MAG: single-stranded DNA-binding protein [Bacillati bacterium ANGP1]|uniref:Single-stranded DNA-binding protein n=1 Tax=Candidatus Segetimicrobium genomatis TaxID=2569760 RepID=A0A537J224_9BACT|nr:MAG: single-stranded DNA-binding protein [Terrabacteria group bacterium ANGP1]